MSTPVPAGTTAEEGADRRELVLELRHVEHWRRLVAARLDLAVAAVTAVDEPVVRLLPAAPVLPWGLREQLGLPGCVADALPEAALLPRLRALLRDLDRYAGALRAQAGAELPPGVGPVVPAEAGAA
jgi:hypothetical protein